MIHDDESDDREAFEAAAERSADLRRQAGGDHDEPHAFAGLLGEVAPRREPKTARELPRTPEGRPKVTHRITYPRRVSFCAGAVLRVEGAKPRRVRCEGYAGDAVSEPYAGKLADVDGRVVDAEITDVILGGIALCGACLTIERDQRERRAMAATVGGAPRRVKREDLER